MSVKAGSRGRQDLGIHGLSNPKLLGMRGTEVGLMIDGEMYQWGPWPVVTTR